MLENFEKKLVKKFYILNSIAIPSFVMTFVTLGVWLVLIFIDDFVFQNNGFFELGLYTMLVIVALYLFLYCYSTLRVRFGMLGKKWKNIVGNLSVSQDNYMYTQEMAQANAISSAARLTGSDALEAVGAAETLEVAGMIAEKMMRNVKKVMDRCEIKVSIKKYILALIFIPTIVLVSVYIPSIINSKQAMEERISIITLTMEDLKNKFELNGYKISVNDIKRESDWYSFIARKDFDSDIEQDMSNNKLDYYVSIEIKKDGLIKEINYCLDVDKNITKEENITKLYNKVKEINDILKNTEIGTKVSNLFVDEVFIREMAASYLESNGNVDVFESVKNEKMKSTFSFNIEDYNSDEPYLYFSIGEL